MNKKTKRYLWIFNLIFLIILILYITYMLFFPSIKASNPNLFIENTDSEYKYIALGDSYSAGTGAGEENSWPSQLVKDLKDDGINIELIANPSRNGFTTQNLIDYELPFIYESDVNFVSIQIGVNDWVQDVSKEEFEENFIFILDEVLKKIPNKNIFVITIPDFSVSPNGRYYSGGRNVPEGLKEFNSIIINESENRNITVIDIFELSKNNDSIYFSGDGLHPSKEGYKLWKDYMYEEIYNLIAKQN